MEIKASLRNYRIAPRKIRLIADLIRGKTLEDAKREIKFYKKRGSLPVSKILDSATANAKNNLDLKNEEVKKLFIKKIVVEEGPKLKRWRPVSRGSANEIKKRTSHIKIILAPKENDKKNKLKKSSKNNK
ncbi:MAG: 50S ribosomal protein L22 [Candidatus Pacebacteria bacterium]|nr:50S ribosomal protein L22 [Candidatus Paceibacterota bacterium]